MADSGCHPGHWEGPRAKGMGSDHASPWHKGILNGAGYLCGEGVSARALRSREQEVRPHGRRPHQGAPASCCLWALPMGLTSDI